MVAKRLAAILAADVVGFSQLMQTDEEGAYEALVAHRSLTDPIIEAHRGRIVGTAGDSVLAEFVSVLDAVEAAVEIQDAGRMANRDRDGDPHIRYRIGINLGDVMVAEDGDIFGDGVNIAARLEALAPPEGIYVSDTVYRSVQRRAGVEFVDVGEQPLKNIADPVRIWAVADDAHGTATVDRSRNPFKGLRAFQEDDAADFHGRSALTDSLLRRLAAERFLAVVGPSGSGKSSVVRAGLIPRLRAGAVSGSDEWLTASMVPGTRPFAEIEAALLRSQPGAVSSLSEQLRDEESPILRAVLRVLPDERSSLLLLIDQFEEVFSLVEEETVRQRFLNGLVDAVAASGDRLRIVVTMRADFYDGPLRYQSFGSLFTQHMVSVMPMTAAELEEAVVAPAGRAGVTIEEPVVRRIVADVIDQPGGLPLFQYALTELFERRSSDTLALADYEAIGGVNGSLTRRADELFDQLSPDSQAAAKQMFLRLVTITDQGEDSRRRVPVTELNAIDVGPEAMQPVLDAFGRSRLLTFDRDAGSGAPTVEVAHEALLREWQRLGEWIDDSRADLHRHGTFAAAVNEWIAADQDEDFLLSGGRLQRYEAWAATSALQLTEQEREFLDRSLSRRAAEAAAEEERRRAAEGLQRRARTRLITAGTAVVVLLAVLAAVAFNVLGSDDPAINVIFRGRDEAAIGAVVAAGIDRAERELDVEVSEIVPVASLGEDFESAAATGGLVVAIGSFDGEVMLGVAPSFPEATYAIVDSTVSVGDADVTEVVYEVHEGAFLIGAAAALKSNTNRIGYVGGIRTPAIETFRAGYEAGARTVRPDIEILAAYIEPADGDPAIGFSSPNLGAVTAERLFRSGADVIFHAAGGSGFGVLETAARLTPEMGTQLWHIGVDGDEYLQWAARPDLQPHVLTSLVKRFDEGVFVVIDRYVGGSIETDVLTLGLADGGVGYSVSGSFIDDIRPRLDELEQQILAGTIVVPTTPSGELLPLLAASPDAAGNPAGEQVLEEYLRAAAAGDWERASATLQSMDVIGPFGAPIRDFFDFDAQFGIEIIDVSCESQGDQVTCTTSVVDSFTQVIGPEPAARSFTAVVADGKIATFTSAVGSDDPLLDEVFRWLFATHPDDAATACGDVISGACATLIIERLEEWAAQR